MDDPQQLVAAGYDAMATRFDESQRTSSDPRGYAHDERTLVEVLAVASPIPRTHPERDLLVI
jgi:hypothetical protein